MSDTPTLYNELRSLLNRHNVEAGSNTPDFILADFMKRCLEAYDAATRGRDAWYGVTLVPGASKYPEAR